MEGHAYAEKGSYLDLYIIFTDGNLSGGTGGESAQLPADGPSPRGTVLYEKNADERLAPASVTKVMTLLLVMEAIDRGQLHWEDTITASAAAAAKGGSQVYLEEGEQMPLWEMLKCVVVSSANDCATALAEAVAGSESGFVEKMNQRAGELGMENTHFANCTGLDDEAGPDVHYTTARDIAIMSRQLLGHDRYPGIHHHLDGHHSGRGLWAQQHQ